MTPRLPRAEEEARGIADKIRCTPSVVDIRSRVKVWEHLIAAAIRAAREAGARAMQDAIQTHEDSEFTRLPHLDPAAVVREAEEKENEDAGR